MCRTIFFACFGGNGRLAAALSIYRNVRYAKWQTGSRKLNRPNRTASGRAPDRAWKRHQRRSSCVIRAGWCIGITCLLTAEHPSLSVVTACPFANVNCSTDENANPH